MNWLGILILFVMGVIFVVGVLYYYQGLVCNMCLGCARDCRTCSDTCCDRKTDDYNPVDPTDEFSEEELSDSEETIVRSPEITDVPASKKSEYNSLDLHF